MLQWPTSNRLDSKDAALNRIGLMLGRNRIGRANIRLLLDQCLVLDDISNTQQPPAVDVVKL